MALREIRARGGVEKIRARLDKVAASDHSVEKMVKITMYVLIVLGIAMAGAFARVMALEGKGGWELLAAVAILFFVCLVVYLGAKGQDLEDRRIELGREFFHVIGQDIPSTVDCSLFTNFQGYERHGKITHREGWLLSWRKKFTYSDTWFQAAGRLHDGNRFKFDVEQVVDKKIRTRLKFGRKLKIRTRVSEIFMEKLTLALRIDPLTYPQYSAIKSHLSPGLQVGSMTVDKVSLTGSTLRLAAHTGNFVRSSSGYAHDRWGTEHMIKGRDMVMLFMKIYQCLQQCE